MNPNALVHKAKFKYSADKHGLFYYLIKLDHPTLTLWILVSEDGYHWCGPKKSALEAFGNCERDFTFIQFEAKSFDVSL